ncbi:MAG TPA: TIM barrel protein [Candidatus Limnocylindrales bacterium]
MTGDPPVTDSNPALLAGSAPVCFGGNEVLPPNAWMPDGDAIIEAISDLGYLGTELGPPGFLGDGPEVRERLGRRRLELIGSFLPMHFSRQDRFDDERAWLTESLAIIREASGLERPFAILSDGFDEPERMAFAGRIEEHPEAWLRTRRFQTLMDNLHRAAEICQAAGFEAVLHHHAGTYIETGAEIRRVLDAMDPALLGLCLDTGHARFGGADPTALVHTYHELIRHVHLKDCSTAVLNAGRERGEDFEVLVQAGAFCELGQGDAGVADCVEALRQHDYNGWIVVEQDRYLLANDTFEDVVAAQRRNREYLATLGI